MGASHIFFVTLLPSILTVPLHSGDISSEVEWKSAVRLIEYNGYKSVSLTKFIIPEASTEILWDISADTLPNCPSRNVFIYIRHGSYPLATPYNETYPENFYVEKDIFLTLSTNNVSLPYTIKSPQPGPWFLAGFLPKAGKKITQAGLNDNRCAYGMGVRVISNYLTNIQEVSIGKKYSIVIPVYKSKTLRLTVPEGTVSYSVTVDGCFVNHSNTTQCPLSIIAASNHIPDLALDTSVNCTTDTCHLKYLSPTINGWNYISVVPHFQPNVADVQIDLEVDIQNCIINQYNVVNPIEPANNTENKTEIIRYKPSPPVLNPLVLNGSCELITPMGRFDVLSEDFMSVFVLPDKFFFPLPDIKLYCPYNQVLLTNFDLLPERDAGGTLNVVFLTSKVFLVPPQDAVLFLCLMKGSIPSMSNVRHCPGGVGLTINTTSASAASAKLYIPYPSGGRWYMGLNSMCINKNKTEENCMRLPVVSVQMYVTRCVDNKCGNKGNCKEFLSGMLLFSTCDCLSGNAGCLSSWQGYGCTDGSVAELDSILLTSLLLLTLSNAFFIPGIFFSIKRKMFVEGLVYVFTMFFSTFYHACDVNNVKYTFCMMDYGVLSFCDFYGSIMSFWVTLLAMSRLNDTVRSFFHMLGALALALGVEYDKHGLWVFVAPALGGVIIMSVSWVVQCHRRKGCYPSKWRYMKFILPGILLAGTGLVIFAFLETDDNYKYTHSAWHVVIALSIVFLIPSRKKSQDNQGYSLVQSGRMEAVGMVSADGTVDDSDDECILQSSRNRPDWNVIL